MQVLLQPPEVSGSGTPRCATSVPKSTMRCATSGPTECKDGVVEQAVLSRSIYQVGARAVVTRLAERSSAEHNAPPHVARLDWQTWRNPLKTVSCAESLSESRDFDDRGSESLLSSPETAFAVIIFGS